MFRSFGQRWRFEDRFGEAFVVVGWGHVSPAERATALDPISARWILQHRWQSWSRDEGRHDLLQIHALLNYDEFNIRNVTTQELVGRVLDAVDRGRILVLRVHGRADSRGPADGVSDLVFHVMADRREISLDGQAYRLVDLSDRLWAAGRDTWRLVEPAEAVAIVEKLVNRGSRTPDEQAAWAALLAAMKADGTNPRIGVLRVRRGGVAAQPEAEAPRRPAARPPQPEQDLSWIEVHVNDTAGNPYSGRVRVNLPNGAKVDASTDDDGVLRLDGILPGSCTVALLDVSERLRAG